MAAVGLAGPERLVRVFLDEGPAVGRLARAAILTERELLMLRHLPSHLSNAEIARECPMSVNTVTMHLKNIYAKLGVSTSAQTVERGRLIGLL